MISYTHLVETYLNCFKGREDFIACQEEDYYYPINHPLDKYILKKHIEGIETFGFYVLTQRSQCNLICIDIDIPKNELQNIDFKNPIIKFNALNNQLLSFIDFLTRGFSFSHQNILLEDSGGRGYHIWIFFSEAIDGSTAIYLNKILKSNISFDFEFFPKQPTLDEKRKYGNLIKLPLGIHKKYQQRSAFFIVENSSVNCFNSIEENLLHLNSIQRVESAIVKNIIDKYKKEIPFEIETFPQEIYEVKERKIFKKNLQFLFDHCSALNSLKEKAMNGIKLEHLEAFHLTNILLSLDNVKTDLHLFFKKSFKENYSEGTTNREIKSILSLKPSSCKTLQKHRICTGYCKKELELRNNDPLLYNTNPLFLWLEPIDKKTQVKKYDNLLENISSIENIKKAYSRLKEYHKNEDALFYDEFDYGFFEENFDENIHFIALALKNRVDIPSINYTKVLIPKKLDEEDNLKYRQMAYSSVFDQVVIQSVFNVIADLLEKDFEESSFGYRLNINDINSDKIFEDWKEKYPQFRNSILSKLRSPEIKYYVCCDIKGYYDNIRKDYLIGLLRGIINDDYIFNLIKKVIESYSFNETNNQLGIPQGPAYARPLANLYLNEFDKEISKKANYYFRYVDDFFILFDSKEKAKDVLEWTTKRISLFGLELSSDKNGATEIINANDEKIIIDKIDSIRYGIFEEFKFLPYLGKDRIKEFYSTATQRIISVENSKKINENIPSLVYLYSEEINTEKELQKEIIEIIEQLVEKKKFFPKKIKTLFTRILDLYSKLNRDFISLFDNLEDTHKIYFLLSLYEKYQLNPQQYKDYLSSTLNKTLRSSNPSLIGFSTKISQMYKDDFQIKFDNNSIIDNFTSEKNVFLGCKFLSTIDYFCLSPENQEKLLNFFKPSTNYLLKKHLFYGLENFAKFKQIDTILFSNILKENYFLLHIECCRAISFFISRNPLFDIILNFIVSEKPIYKTLLIDTLGRYIFKKYAASDVISLENLIEIYKKGIDNDISSRVLEVIARIKNEFKNCKPSPIDNCNKIASYEECFYYKANDCNQKYIEIIPSYKLDDGKPNWYNRFKTSFSQLNEYKIIPKSFVEFNLSHNNSIIITSTYDEKFKDISSINLTWKKPEDCFKIILLINSIYKKAHKYLNLFGKFPLIKNDNILVSLNDWDIVFLKVGLTTLDSYTFKSYHLDNSNPDDISKNLFLFIKDILFDEKNEWDDFKKISKDDITLFLRFILERLNTIDFSLTRLNSITQKIQEIGIGSKENICHFYFSERLRSNLFDHSKQRINWMGITRSVQDLYEDFAVIYDKINFTSLKYYNKLRFNSDLPNNLHCLSKVVINLNLNLPKLLPNLINSVPLKIFSLLNCFSIFCIELQSMFKVLLFGDYIFQYLPIEKLQITYDGFSFSFSHEEVENINKLIKITNSKKNTLFNGTVYYSLKEISFLCFSKETNLSITNNTVELICPNNISNKCFEKLINFYLIKIPEIELSILSIINKINFSLSKNFDFQTFEDDEISSIKNKISLVLHQITQFLKKYPWKRRHKRKFKLSTIGTKIILKKLFRKKIEVSAELSKCIPLTNLAPTHSSVISYDIYKKEVINIVVPNERVLELIRKLKKGKLFNFKISYLYSGKMLFIIDLVIFLIIFFGKFLTLKKSDSEDLAIVLKIISELLGGLLFIIAGKIIVWDLRHWIKNFNLFIEYITKKHE